MTKRTGPKQNFAVVDEKGRTHLIDKKSGKKRSFSFSENRRTVDVGTQLRQLPDTTEEEEAAPEVQKPGPLDEFL
jgi:hypothetical protein